METLKQVHAQAYGCSIPDRNLDNFIKYANEKLKDFNFDENVYNVNFMRECSDSDLRTLVLALGKANGIWGSFNPEPLIYVNNIYVNPADIRVMGANMDTLKIESNGIAFMKFKAKELIEEIKEQTDTIKLEIVGRANINEWGGHITPQIFIDDYQINSINKYSF